MPETVIPRPYKSVARLCIETGQVHQMFGRSLELDREYKQIWWQLTDGKVGRETSEARMRGIARFLGTKRWQTSRAFDHMDGPTRAGIMNYTANNALYREGQEGFGSTGRFSRAMKATMDASEGFGNVMTIWTNVAVQVMNLVFQDNWEAPIVAEQSFYRIGSGPLIENDGSDITVSEGTRFRMYTNAVGYNAAEWFLNGTGTGVVNDDYIDISAIAPTDAGDYINTYSNDVGSTDSDTFTVVVS